MNPTDSPNRFDEFFFRNFEKPRTSNVSVIPNDLCSVARPERLPDDTINAVGNLPDGTVHQQDRHHFGMVASRSDGRPHPLQRGDPVTIRQQQIQNDAIQRFARRDQHGFVTAYSRQDFMPFFFQPLRHAASERRFVFDEQQSCHNVNHPVSRSARNGTNRGFRSPGFGNPDRLGQWIRLIKISSTISLNGNSSNAEPPAALGLP